MMPTTTAERPDVVVIAVPWLPRYGRDWHYFADLGVMAVSLALMHDGIEAALADAGVRARRPEPGQRLVMRTHCPLCGRNDSPSPGKRPTVSDLGLLDRR